MYKCGWNGCEKAYGTLNHLNAHVTMQSHGQKRTPEEFKEIRKEWKAKKKEEEAQRKADDEPTEQTSTNSAGTKVALLAKLPSTGKCDKLSVCLDKVLLTRNCHPLVINLRPRATMLLHSMVLKAQVCLRAWLITLSRPTDRTRRCTSKVIRHLTSRPPS